MDYFEYYKQKQNEDQEKWQVSGISGGKLVTSGEIDKKDLNDKTQEESTKTHVILPEDSLKCQPPMSLMEVKLNSDEVNPKYFKSVSTVDLHKSPSSISQKLKLDTSGRYRSLDTLADAEHGVFPPQIQGSLANANMVRNMVTRQSTFSIDGEQDDFPDVNVIRRSRTSSPFPTTVEDASAVLLDKINNIELYAENLLTQIQDIKKVIESGNLSNISVSTIGKPQDFTSTRPRSSSTISKRSLAYASSPNLNRVDSKIPSAPSYVPRQNPTPTKAKINTSQQKPSRVASFKRSIPTKLSTISPSFVGKAKKNLGIGTLGTPLSGSYKSLTEKTSMSGLPTRLGSVKLTSTSQALTDSKSESGSAKKMNLYSHIKPTIQKYASIKK